MSSDVCKHCTHAGCLDVCPTGALFRTEFGTVVVQDDICNGCGYCVPSCPYGVIDVREDDGGAHKCTLCYDRLGAGMEPACAKACPTNSIQFGDLDELQAAADARLAELHGRGVTEARLYGRDPDDGVGGDGAFFLLLDEPEVYGMPPDPIVTTRDLPEMWRNAALTAVGLGAAVVGGVLGRSQMTDANPAEMPERSRLDRDAVTPRGRKSRRRGRGEELQVPEAEFRSYYGRPIIKAPVWKNPDVPLYLFLGGLAATSSGLGALGGGHRPADPATHRAPRRGRRGGRRHRVPRPRPAPPVALPAHAAGVQADVAAVGGHLDPLAVRDARGRDRGVGADGPVPARRATRPGRSQP